MIGYIYNGVCGVSLRCIEKMVRSVSLSHWWKVGFRTDNPEGLQIIEFLALSTAFCRFA